MNPLSGCAATRFRASLLSNTMHVSAAHFDRVTRFPSCAADCQSHDLFPHWKIASSSLKADCRGPLVHAERGIRTGKSIPVRCSVGAASSQSQPSSVPETPPVDARDDSDNTSSAVTELKRKYGSPGVDFASVANLKICVLSLEDGCQAKIIIDHAQVTSYKADMWHGTCEEVLFSAENADMKKYASPVLGGIVVSFPLQQLPPDRQGSSKDATWPADLAERATWKVVAASCKPGSWAKVVLASDLPDPTRRSFHPHPPPFVSARYTLTLTSSSLGSVLRLTNRTRTPLTFEPSIRAALSVGSNQDATLLGLRGREYLATAADSREGGEGGGEEGVFESIRRMMARRRDDVSAQKVTSASSPSPSPESGDGNGGTESPGVNRTRRVLGWERGRVGEGDGDRGFHVWSRQWRRQGEERQQLGVERERLYRQAPAALSMVDKGRRRSFTVEGVNLEDVIVESVEEGSSVQNWHRAVTIGYARLVHPVVIAPGEEWGGAQVVRNPGAKVLVGGGRGAR